MRKVRCLSDQDIKGLTMVTISKAYMTCTNKNANFCQLARVIFLAFYCCLSNTLFSLHRSIAEYIVSQGLNFYGLILMHFHVFTVSADSVDSKPFGDGPGVQDNVDAKPFKGAGGGGTKG